MNRSSLFGRLTLLLALGLCTGLAGCAYVSAADQDARLLEFDDDGDGFADVDAGGTDCDDGDAAVFPGATEVCNGLDDDCDGVEDDGLKIIRWIDADGDGAGATAGATLACPDDPAFVDQPGDCDDADAQVHPDAEERCNDLDDDCDREVDEDAGTDWFPDRDADGFGAADARPLRACDAPPGFVASNDDCHDGEAGANPEATEICDDLDNDCNGQVDEGTAGEAVWFIDVDGDGFGDSEVSEAACIPQAGWVSEGGDCDDTAADVHPNAPEPSCDGIDQNCDGNPDDPTRLLSCD